jgi:hypothetical protein
MTLILMPSVIMLSVTIKSIMLDVVMLNVVALTTYGIRGFIVQAHGVNLVACVVNLLNFYIS